MLSKHNSVQWRILPKILGERQILTKILESCMAAHPVKPFDHRKGSFQISTLKQYNFHLLPITFLLENALIFLCLTIVSLLKGINSRDDATRREEVSPP